jgi:hypothetical protein
MLAHVNEQTPRVAALLGRAHHQAIAPALYECPNRVLPATGMSARKMSPLRESVI